MAVYILFEHGVACFIDHISQKFAIVLLQFADTESLARTVSTHAIVRAMELANQLTACVTAVYVSPDGQRLVVMKVGCMYTLCYC